MRLESPKYGKMMETYGPSVCYSSNMAKPMDLMEE
jgi:hypothetical protein